MPAAPNLIRSASGRARWAYADVSGPGRVRRTALRRRTPRWPGTGSANPAAPGWPWRADLGAGRTPPGAGRLAGYITNPAQFLTPGLRTDRRGRPPEGRAQRRQGRRQRAPGEVRGTQGTRRTRRGPCDGRRDARDGRTGRGGRGEDPATDVGTHGTDEGTRGRCQPPLTSAPATVRLPRRRTRNRPCSRSPGRGTASCSVTFSLFR
jgi:hypothetical protein